MKQLINRLVALKTEAELIRDIIDKELEDGEILGSPLWSVCHDIDSVVGAIMVKAHRDGNMTFNDIVK